MDKRGTETRVYQRNFVLTDKGEMLPYGEWYENKHLRSCKHG